MAKGPRIPEKVVQRQIIALLRSLGGKVYSLGTSRPKGSVDFSTRQTPGIPDIFVFMPHPTQGRVPVWIEAKAEGGTLRPEQVEFRDECKAAALSHVVGGYDAVVAFLLEDGFIHDGQVPSYRLPQAKQDLFGPVRPGKRRKKFEPLHQVCLATPDGAEG